MKPVHRVLLATAAVFGVAPASAQVQTFRCNNDLVQIGDAKAAVVVKCGSPVVKDSFCKPVGRRTAPDGGSTVIINAPCESVDEWTFNPGYGQFMTTLRFESGKLVSISYGDRVK